jgi:hypothetical protein
VMEELPVPVEPLVIDEPGVMEVPTPFI